MLMNCTALNLYGPSKALRGKRNDSIVSAVEGLRQERMPVILGFGCCTNLTSFLELTELGCRCASVPARGNSHFLD